MKVLKENLLKFTRIIISLGILLGTISTIIFTYLHIKMLPIEIYFYPKEIILFFTMILLYLFSIRYKIKHINIIAIIGLLLGMFNLLGFKIVIKLFMRG